MTIGTGILLSAVFLGLVLLYIKSENKPKWIKVIKIVLILLPLTILGLGSLIYYQDRKKHEEVSSFEETSLRGIELGTSLNDVQFQFGRLEKLKGPIFGLEAYGFQKQSPELLNILAKDSKVVVVIYGCQMNHPYGEDPHSLAGIRCGSSSQQLISKFGEKNIRVWCSKEFPERRMFDVTNKKLRYHLEQNKVSLLFLSALPLDQLITGFDTTCN